MNRTKKYFLNALLLSCVTVLMRGVAVSFNAYVTQKIGSEAIGLFTLVMSVYTLAVTLATSGVNLAAVRLTAECYAKCESTHVDESGTKKALRQEMRGCIIYSLLFGAFASLLLYILSDVIGIYLLCDERTIPSLKLLSAALLPISLSSALAGYFTGLRKIYKNALISLCEQFVKITCTTAALITIAPKGIEYACLAVVGGSAVSEAASLLSSMIFYYLDKNKMQGKGGILKKEKLSSFTRASEIAFPTALGSYVRQGLLCAEHIAIPAGLRKFHKGSGDALSSYGTLHAMAFPLIFFPSSVIGAFASLLIPELCEYASLGQNKKVRMIADRVVTVGLIFAIGCGGLFLSFGREMGEAIYASSEAGGYICALAPLVPVMYIDTSVDSILKGLGEQVYCMKVNILDSVLSLTLVLLLVPRYGTWGYIACVYIAELVNATLSIGKMITKTKLKISPARILKPLLCIFTTITFIRIFNAFFPSFDQIYLEICLTFIIYSALIIPKSAFFRKKSYKTEKPLFTS